MSRRLPSPSPRLTGMDAYLSPEMKSTGEAIGYDRRLNRALYKALKASGVRMKDYGTVIVTIADEDKEEALPLVRRFYKLGFNIEATLGTAMFLKQHGIRTRIRGKISEGSEEILDSIRAGYVSYIINTRAVLSGVALRGRRRHPPLCRTERRDHLYLSGYRPHRPGRAGGVHPGNLHHRRGEEREMTASPACLSRQVGVFCPGGGRARLVTRLTLPPLYPAGGVPALSPVTPCL